MDERWTNPRKRAARDNYVKARLPGRLRYAAHIGDLQWNQCRLVVVLYVDPETRRMYAQPHPNVSSKLIASWRKAGVKSWPYEQARDFARWLELHAAYVNPKTPRAKLVPRLPAFWTDYVSGGRDDKPPKPLALPRNPEMYYARKGWSDWGTWSWARSNPKESEQVPMNLG